MSSIGAIAEPSLVVALLIGGTWINRAVSTNSGSSSGSSRNSPRSSAEHCLSPQDDVESSPVSPSLLSTTQPRWRTRTVGIGRFSRDVVTPNTARFRSRLLSRVLERFPFLVESWYWALIYWVYQLGRAVSAVWIKEGTVVAARNHALQVVAAEESLHIFWELPVQHFFMRSELAMTWVNRLYSFIHIPGSIAFLAWLFYYTNTRLGHDRIRQSGTTDPAGPHLYESRRRTMALCNLLAFVIFTLWPCMPPRLMSVDSSQDEAGALARSYGFVDTVHGPGGDSSVWTDNRFTNKLAAMPSMHFGYALLIGLTIGTIPLVRARTHTLGRALCLGIGTTYPLLILVAIVATANHFILDAVAGAVVCGVAWWGNSVLLNLLALEDWFLWMLRIHKPSSAPVDATGEEYFDKELVI